MFIVYVIPSLKQIKKQNNFVVPYIVCIKINNYSKIEQIITFFCLPMYFLYHNVEWVNYDAAS